MEVALGHEQRAATKKGARKLPAKQPLTAFLPVEANALQFSSVSHDVFVELPHLAVRVP